jgi:hypothetical protein
MPPPPPLKKSKKTPAAKSKKTPAAPKKRESYGQAKFFDKTGTIRTNEATAKVNREKKMVESPFKEEVPDRIKLLKGLKKMIQKIVTGAEAKRCPKKNPGCTGKEMVKGPYLVSLATVKQLADIIKLTPHDGHRGQRMKALKDHRAAYLQLKTQRKQLVRKLIAKNVISRTAYLNTLSNLRSGSKAIAGKAVVTLGKRREAAAKGRVAIAAIKRKVKRGLKNAVSPMQTRPNAVSPGSSSTQSAGSY